MSLYDKASLVLIPSGTKAGKVYSQKPTSGDGDFDFTRSSYATRVNSQGLIEKERSNLLLQSNSFDTTWGAPAGGISTPTSGQTGYDGTSDAWLLSKTASGHSRLIQTISSSGLKTFSLYAKEGTLKMVRLLALGGGNPEAHFNLNTGNIDVVDSDVIASNMQSVGSGWYRCSISFDDTITEVRIYPLEAQGDTTTLGNIYIQDAQVEQGLVATDVIETTTSAVYEGITDNVPRLDYDGDCPSLLLEPQRTNLIDYSENFSHASWLKNNSTLTSGFLSPDGTKNAFEYVGSGATQDLRKSITVSDNYTYSFYVKAINSPYIRLRTIDGSCWFNMTTNTVATNTFASAEIKNAGNGWYRLSVTSSSFTANNTLYIHPHAIDNTTTELDGGEFLIYGSQLEQGSYATSYIPTYGTSVTRNGDACNNAGDSTIFNDEEGVLYVEVEDAKNGRIAIRNSDANRDEVVLGLTGNRFFCRIRENSNNIFTEFSDSNLDLNLSHKLAIKYKSGDSGFWINGVKSSITDTFTLNSLNELLFTSEGNNFYGKVKSLLYFNRALTDTELADLTT